MSSAGEPSSHRQVAIWTVIGGVCAVIGLGLALVQFARADESDSQPPPPAPPPANPQPPGPEPEGEAEPPPPPPPPPDAVLDISLTALFGADSVATGFPDPLGYSVLAGGAVDASYLDGCNGYATQAPTLELAWEGAGGPLSFVFVADIPGEDGTLVINAADSSWACDDDSYGDRNPLVEFPAAVSGTYDIWVGSFAANTTVAGTLFVTELPP